jgi:hypothetical protein
MFVKDDTVHTSDTLKAVDQMESLLKRGDQNVDQVPLNKERVNQ